MQSKSHLAPDQIRSDFSSALSAMYRKEVPAYGTLMSLVAKVNDEMLEADPDLRESLAAAGSLDRLADERHGAIRLGWPSELFTIRRIFAVMGMFPVGYYDLSAAGVPVHSTAFRPTDPDSLARNPFRVFTSLLRLDLHSDTNLRDEAAEVLAKRRIFTDGALELLEKAERDGGLTHLDASGFVKEILETFRWQEQATVSKDMYERLHAAHRLVADVVSFKGPHINHLTPRTLDIDEVQRRMPDEGISPKAVIEGPPRRACPILLRQTSFKALEEQIAFGADDGEWKTGTHRARFGEIEQRGAALTPKGRAIVDAVRTIKFLIMGQFLTGWSQEEIDTFLPLMDRFFAWVDDSGDASAERLHPEIEALARDLARKLK